MSESEEEKESEYFGVDRYEGFAEESERAMRALVAVLTVTAVLLAGYAFLGG